MRMRSSQDIAAGLLLLAFGLAGLWIGADYPMGTAQRPGTGVLPHILSWCLVATGVLIWLKAALAGSPPLSAWAWRPAIMVTLATVAVALLVDRLGLVVSMIVSMSSQDGACISLRILPIRTLLFFRKVTACSIPCFIVPRNSGERMKVCHESASA